MSRARRELEACEYERDRALGSLARARAARTYAAALRAARGAAEHARRASAAAARFTLAKSRSTAWTRRVVAAVNGAREAAEKARIRARWVAQQVTWERIEQGAANAIVEASGAGRWSVGGAPPRRYEGALEVVSSLESAVLAFFEAIQEALGEPEGQTIPGSIRWDIYLSEEDGEGLRKLIESLLRRKRDVAAQEWVAELLLDRRSNANWRSWKGAARHAIRILGALSTWQKAGIDVDSVSIEIVIGRRMHG